MTESKNWGLYFQKTMTRKFMLRYDIQRIYDNKWYDMLWNDMITNKHSNMFRMLDFTV